jgi:outer membrane murein-binding lipoprotein Lpp
MKSMRDRRVARAGVVGTAMIVAGLAVAGCTSTGIAIREQFGQAKREQLVSRVKEAQTAQENAKEQFATTMEEFKALTGFDGGDLEKVYSKLEREYERSKSRADTVRDRIRSVDAVSNAMFREWRGELAQYESASLRAASEQQLRDTELRYNDLIGAMKRAEATMDPVLKAFRDRVLFLKHNLNAAAIASLGTTAGELEGDIARLIADMNTSIAEADEFIEQMGK